MFFDSYYYWQLFFTVNSWGQLQDLGKRKLNMQRCKTSYFHWKTGVLQIKVVQKEGLFGRFVSTLTSEINDHKRLYLLQNNNLMVQIESYSLSKTVELPYINPRYFFIIYFQWYEDQIWPKIVRVDIIDHDIIYVYMCSADRSLMCLVLVQFKFSPISSACSLNYLI